MGQPQIDWPGMRWDLTAPEWYELNYVGHVGSAALKLAVKELVVRGALRVERVETRRRRGSRRSGLALTDGPLMQRTPPPALAPVLGTYSDAKRQVLQTTDEAAGGMRPIEGMRIEDFARAARRRFGGRVHKYVRECLLPLLSGAGLVTLSGPSGGRTSWTDSGRQAIDELDEWMAVGRRNLRPWVLHDPARGVAWASSGGAAVLLMNDFYPQFVRLGQFLADRGVPAGGGGGEIGIPLSLDDPSGAEASSELSGAELSDLDLGSMAFDLGGFDHFDGAFTAFDVGIDAGGVGVGGGGGDGGGG